MNREDLYDPADESEPEPDHDPEPEPDHNPEPWPKLGPYWTPPDRMESVRVVSDSERHFAGMCKLMNELRERDKLENI